VKTFDLGEVVEVVLHRGARLFDPAAPDYHIVPIEDGALSRSDGALRLVEFHCHCVINQRYNRRPWLETIPDLHLAANGLREAFNGDPIRIAHRKRPLDGILANDHAIQIWLDPHHILRLAGRNQTLSLADGELVNALVPADNVTVLRYDLAWGTRGLTPLPCILFDEIGVGTAFHKTDFLRLCLF